MFGRVGMKSFDLTLGNSTVCNNTPVCRTGRLNMGMIGFDIVCAIVRSGSRMQGYLVNAPSKTISAKSNRTDFALAA